LEHALRLALKTAKGTTPPWLMEDGNWNDAGAWDDDSQWNDGTPPAETDPPIPNPASFEVQPFAISSTEVRMTASAGLDATPVSRAAD